MSKSKLNADGLEGGKLVSQENHERVTALNLKRSKIAAKSAAESAAKSAAESS